MISLKIPVWLKIFVSPSSKSWWSSEDKASNYVIIDVYEMHVSFQFVDPKSFVDFPTFVLSLLSPQNREPSMPKGDIATAQVLGEFSIKPEAKQPQLDTSEVRSLISSSS